MQMIYISYSYYLTELQCQSTLWTSSPSCSSLISLATLSLLNSTNIAAALNNSRVNDAWEPNQCTPCRRCFFSQKYLKTQLLDSVRIRRGTYLRGFRHLPLVMISKSFLVAFWSFLPNELVLFLLLVPFLLFVFYFFLFSSRGYGNKYDFSCDSIQHISPSDSICVIKVSKMDARNYLNPNFSVYLNSKYSEVLLNLTSTWSLLKLWSTSGNQTTFLLAHL